MAGGYDYGNARLRTKRSRLLKEADYTTLLAKNNIEEFVTALAETPYKEDVELALTRLSGVRCVFEAVRANLTRTLRQVHSFFEGEPRQLIELLFRRWDRHNLLAILRGQSQEATPEQVLPALIPVGRLDEVSLRELARQPGIRAVIELMTVWQLPYARALRQVQPRSGALPDLDQLELALNRFHFASLREALSQGNDDKAILLEHFQTEVDRLNLMTCLRLAHQPELIPLIQQRYNTADIQPLLIEPGGRLSSQRLVELVSQASGLESLVRGLKDTRYGPALETAWQRYQTGTGDLSVFERELERWHIKRLTQLFISQPLSIAIPLGYMAWKETEVANLRLIAQAVALGLNREEVRAELIVG